MRLDMVNDRRGRHLPLLFAHFAKRIERQVIPPRVLPSTAVKLVSHLHLSFMLSQILQITCNITTLLLEVFASNAKLILS